MRKMTTKEACGNREVVSLPRIVKIMDLVSILRGNEHNGFPVTEHTRSGETLVSGLMLQSENEIPGRTAGCPFITTSYDYDDLDEYGLPGQPKYSHLLKELHRAIKLCERALVSADPVVTSLRLCQQAPVYYPKIGNCAAFLTNYDKASAAKVLFNNRHYNLPPWLISILLDCKNVALNTVMI